MRKVILVSVLLTLAICFSSCGKVNYEKESIVGLTSYEIIEKYGDFDRKQGRPDTDGLYRNCTCGYLIKDAKKGFFGTTPPEYFMIHFDDDGIAFWCNYEKVV